MNNIKKEQWMELYTSNKTSLTKIEELEIRYENNCIYIKNGKEILEINTSKTQVINLKQAL